jgi:hypothetical protein
VGWDGDGEEFEAANDRLRCEGGQRGD